MRLCVEKANKGMKFLNALLLFACHLGSGQGEIKKPI